MRKVRVKHNVIQTMKRLPQAGIIYAIRSQDFVALCNKNQHETSCRTRTIGKMNSNNNKAIITASEDSYNTIGNASDVDSLSQDKHSNSTVSLSSENIMEHLFVRPEKTLHNKNNNSNSKSKSPRYSLIVNRGSILSNESASLKQIKSLSENESTSAYQNSFGKYSQNDKKPYQKIKNKHSIDRKEFKEEALGLIEHKVPSYNDKTAIPVTEVRKEIKKDREIESENHRYSDSWDNYVYQRTDGDLISSYQEMGLELSKLKVKFNELKVENNSLKQMSDNLTMEINNLRHENSSVKTRNETLAARNLENQNLSRIVEVLNKKIRDLNKEIESYHTKESDKTQRIIELENNYTECKEKSVLNMVELEHYKEMLEQKDEEIKRLTQTQRIDENKDLQIKLIHNELIELKGNIRVICRVKPESNSLIQILNSESLQMPVLKNRNKSPVFNFNRVLRPNCSQSDVFNEVKPLVTSFVDGYNVSMITYGQSGSGKTHTMLGVHTDPGIVSYSIRQVFKLCSDRPNWNYRVCLSVLEIYNEIIFDLLACSEQNNRHTVNPQILRAFWRKRTQIHDDGKSIHIKGLSEIEINHEEELLEYISRSAKNRSTAITIQNSDSSRSHFIVMLRICGRNCYENLASQGVLMMCDLAGSENCTSSLFDHSLTESKFISRSLTVLGRVFEALFQKLAVIPFRDSKLTHIMKPSLSGEAKFAFIVTVSGQLENLNNSFRVLQLARKVAQISLGQPRKNQCDGQVLARFTGGF